jgi:hypothetical protein
MIADLCEHVGADVQVVARGIGLDGRIGRKFLHAGPGYGASCFPKDTLALLRTAEQNDSSLRILEAVVASNSARKRRMAQKVLKACGGSVDGKTIVVLGVTFKPNTDDVRESPALIVVPALQAEGATVHLIDPEGRRHDAVRPSPPVAVPPPPAPFPARLRAPPSLPRSQRELPMRSHPRVAIVVATRGRPLCVPFLVRHLEQLTVKPDRVLLTIVEPSDLGEFSGSSLPVEVVTSAPGLPAQRNAALRQLGDGADIVVFLDDDFIPTRFLLEGVVRAFEAFPEAGGLTGEVLADGVKGPGISLEEAEAQVAAVDAKSDRRARAPSCREVPALYGCNMAYRRDSIAGITFDEQLPLSAWLEDRDFSARIRGKRVKTDAFYGVHCGVKAGRERRGQRYGYSQMANPVYLARKGTISARHAAKIMLRSLAINHVRMLRAEPWVDRRGRAHGNWIAIFDYVAGRIDPQRMADPSL